MQIDPRPVWLAPGRLCFPGATASAVAATGFTAFVVAFPSTNLSPMALSAGTRLGYFEIVSSLGAGGMGVVYRARDTRLRRDVALKILPEIFASDPERLHRFQREAQAIAALNHPNVVTMVARR